MKLSDVFALRQSCREFTGEQISDKQLDSLLRAAYAAPAARGGYDGLHLTVLQNAQAMERWTEIFREMAGEDEGDPIHGAPTLIVAAETGEQPALRIAEDAAVIVENMHLAATALGLGSFYIMGLVMATRSNPEVSEILKLPEGYVPAAALAVGFPAKELSQREIEDGKISTVIIK